MPNYRRYKRAPVVEFPERIRPGKEVMKAPVWCSVSLRDGNQAPVEPIVVEEKVEVFNLLVKPGFKEIEVGFPAASQTEYNFLRTLVERKLIPSDVQIQVLVRCREYLIRRMFEILDGIEKVIVHTYNSISTLQRDMIFHKNREDIKDTAVIGTKMVQRYVAEYDAQIRLEYFPESFTSAELEFVLDVCMTVQETQDTTKGNPIIINLPSTAEITTSDMYVDQIGWMNTHSKDKESIILSVHPHNDRGEGVVSTELALLAGADHVEGILLGNGERTGNVNILTVAYSIFPRGISPELSIESIREITEIYERCTKMDILPRHPYTGKLIFIVFSGFHQDAINKGMQALHERNGEYWEVPYLPINPNDIGREYEPIVWVNSQSGKGGVVFTINTLYGFKLPKGMHKEFVDAIQRISEQQGEVAPEQVMEKFRKSYLDHKEPVHFRKCHIVDTETGDGEFATLVKVTYMDHGVERTFEGVGNESTDTVQRGMEDALGIQIKVLNYSGHTLASGSGTETASYTYLVDQTIGKATYGVGVSSNIIKASIRDIFSVANRLFY